MKFFVAICLILLSTFVAFSQPDTILNIENVEIFGHRAGSSKSAGMSVNEIDSAVLSSQKTRALSDILAENSTVFIKNYGRGAFATAAFRGTAASHTKADWNGLPLNSPMSGVTDFSLIPVFLADELSVKHGSASLEDHGGGLGGSVSLQNSANWTNQLSVSYLQSIGSYKSYNEHLKLSAGNSKFQSKTRAYSTVSANDFTFINRMVGVWDSISGKLVNPLDTNTFANFRFQGVIQEIYAKPARNQIVALRYWGQSVNRSLPQATSFEGSEDTNRNRQTQFDHKFTSDFKVISTKSSSNFSLAYSSSTSVYELSNLISGRGFASVIYAKSSEKMALARYGFSYASKRNLNVDLKSEIQHFSIQNIDTVSNNGYTRARTDASVVCSADKSFNDRLFLKILCRQEISEVKLQPIIPYIGLDYKVLAKKNIFLKANFSRNFKQPSLNDLYWFPGGNPNLLPEKGETGELGFRTLFDLHNYHIESELTTFRSDIQNWIIWLPSVKGYWQPFNIERVITQGFEFSAKISGKIYKISYKLVGNYSFTSAKNLGNPMVWGSVSYGQQLAYVPKHSGNLFAQFQYKSFIINWQHTSYSERFTTSAAQIGTRNRMYPYFMNDVVFSYKFSIKNLSLSADFKIFNLFNEVYHSMLYRPMPRRNFLLSIGVEF